MGRSINYIFSAIASIIVLIFLMRFFGVTLNDIQYFITHGIGGALKIITQLRGSILRNPLP